MPEDKRVAKLQQLVRSVPLTPIQSNALAKGDQSLRNLLKENQANGK